eukprot:4049546-Pleurochrysis_carterae.AAC.1
MPHEHRWRIIPACVVCSRACTTLISGTLRRTPAVSRVLHPTGRVARALVCSGFARGDGAAVPRLRQVHADGDHHARPAAGLALCAALP